MIRCLNLSFGYEPGVPVLRDVGLELGPGLHLIVGANGSGKSTLFRLLSGIHPPWSGCIEIEGIDLWQKETASRRHLSFVPEHPDLPTYSSIGDLLRLVASLRGVPADPESWLQEAGLAGHGARTARQLSLGQRRRVHLAAARIGEPPNQLLDEPLDALDAGARVWVIEWIEELLARESTVVVSSHDLEPFLSRASTVVLVEATRLHRLEGPDAEEHAIVERIRQGGAATERPVGD